MKEIDMPIIDKSPIVVIVKDGRYDLFGPPTKRSQFLKKTLDKLGGINEGVSDGTYTYNVRRVGLTYKASLYRLE